MKNLMFYCLTVTTAFCLLLGSLLAAEKPYLPKIVLAQSSIKSIVFMIDRAAMTPFFEELRKFAGKNNFTIQITRTHPDYEDFTVSMSSADIIVLGDIVYSTISLTYPVQFNLDFYKNSSRHLSDKQLGLLVGDLNHMIDRVQGVERIN